jgi:DNA processing protein
VTEREAYIALNLIDQLGPVRVRALVSALGSAAAVFEAGEIELRRVEGIGAELARTILEQRDACDPAAEEAKAARHGARIVAFPDSDYPEPLRTIHDPPLALYLRGAYTEADRHAIAVVGSRRCTLYGRSAADRLAFQLGQAGFTVVSGLARGIDVAAHEGALKGGGRTIAVLGGALDRLYPPECAPLAERIADGRGAVISEYTMGRMPDRTTFPYRNRVISGLSMGTVIVEADTRSGAMITASQALEQGRTVFAVPGRIDSPASRGTHRLIKSGARLVEDAADIFEEFSFLLPPERPMRSEPAPESALPFRFSDEEAAIVEALAEGPLDADSLARQTGLPAAKLGALLIGLEMKRVTRMLPGRQVELTVVLPPRTSRES